MLLVHVTGGPAAANGLSASDQSLLKRAIALARADRWTAYEAVMADVRDPAARSYLLWRRLLSADLDDGHAPVVDFIERHPHWPAIGDLQAVAERMFDHRVDFASRLAFFETRQPLTKEGRLALAEALMDRGDNDEAVAIIRRAWVQADFGTTELRRILRVFGDHLSRDDHRARLDRLLWDGNWRSAERMFSLVGDGHAALARARIALQQRRSGVDGLVSRVPRSLANDPGFLFDRLHWRRRRGLDSGVEEILLQPPEELGRPGAWWYERALLVRDRMDRRRFFEAAKLAKRHGQTSGGSFAEAQWLAGWLSLRHLDEPKTALARFASMYEAVRAPISRGRAAYWAGRAAAQSGDTTGAQRWYERASEHGTSFYGQEAARELGIAPVIDAVALPSADFSQPWRELADVVFMLCRIDEGDSAVPFMRHLALEPGLAERAFALAVACDRPDLAVELGKFGIRAGVMPPVLSFPMLTEIAAAEPGPDLPLVMAISRQESHFDPDVSSSAGALGLMQLMPPTARAMSRKSGVRVTRSELTSRPLKNMALGRFYINQLLDIFDGSKPLAVAAYNAGPSRVFGWIERHGDPRGKSRHAMLDWMELIGFRETRNYVQRVLEGETVYAALLEQENAVTVPLHRSLGPVIPVPRPAANPRR